MQNLSNYLESYKKLIQREKDLLVALNKRVEINEAKKMNSSLTEEEHNEATIICIKTNAEIETLKSVIKEKEKYFENYSKKFEIDLLEANAEFDKLLKKAKVHQKIASNKNLQTILDAIANNNLDEDLDKKVFVYKRLKAMLNG
jgi:hypothetical protein